MTDDAHRADDLGNYKVCDAGDIVINRMRAFQGGVGISPCRGLVSPDYLVLRPRMMTDGRFLHHLFRSTWFIDEMSARLRGIGSVDQGNVRTPRINAEDLGEIEVLLPAVDDQSAIADFLDREAAHIDALLEQKRRLSAVLMERVATLIDAAVWGGSGSRSPTFSSVVRLAQGQVDPMHSPFSEMPLVAPNHIESGTGRLAEVESAAEQGAISGKYLCEPGDVIYSKIRPALAKATIAPWRCLTSADMYPLRPVDGLLPEFLLLILLSRQFTDWAVMESDRVAMPKINRDALGRLRIPLPSVPLQKEVVSQIASHQERANELRSALVSQIDLLVEHRQALITAAVTGQLDIPGVAA